LKPVTILSKDGLIYHASSSFKTHRPLYRAQRARDMTIDAVPTDETPTREALLLESLSKTELMERVKNLQSALEVSRREQIATQALFTKERLGKIEHFAKISHELRSPLNSILLLCNVLTQNNPYNLTQQQKENIIAINAAGKDLLYIINDMIDQSTRENQAPKINHKTFFVYELLHCMQYVYVAQFEQKKVSFSIKNHCENSYAITSDPNKIIQILRNLLSNAYKYTPEGGCVEMKLSHSLEHFMIEVIDSGPGMTIEEQQTIFSPFILGEEGLKNKGESLGLGLSIAKKIAEALEATLTLKSIEGIGSTFTFSLPNRTPLSTALPLSESSICVTQASTPIASPPQKTIQHPLKHKKIMLVEHHLSTIYLFRKTLLTYGAELTHVFDVVEACHCLKLSQNIDLVICSYYEGYTPKQLQACFEAFHVPLIALAQPGERADTAVLLSQLELYLKNR
jgi:signal transduction histidine kinase